MVRIRVAADSVADHVEREFRQPTAIAVTAGVTGATRGLLADMRAKVASAGLGRRLPNAIGAQIFPKNRASMSAAGSITARGKQADMLFDVFLRGADIRPRNRKYLMIPTEAAKRSGLLGVMRLGEGVQSGTRRSLDLQYAGRALGLGNRQVLAVIPPGKAHPTHGYLIARGVVKAKSGGGFRAATKGRVRQGRQAQDVLLAILVPNVKLTPRLDFGDLARLWADRLPGLIDQAMGT